MSDTRGRQESADTQLRTTLNTILREARRR